MAHQKTKICISCHQLFRGRRDAKTCSERCRKRAQRVKTLLVRETELAKESAEKALENLEHELKPAFATEEGFIGDTPATLTANETPVALEGTPSLVTPQNIPATPPSSGI